MLRPVILAAVGVLGCGRLGIDATGPADAPRGGAFDGSIDTPADTPAVPSAICKVDRVPFSAPPALAQLAMAGISEGYAAIWLDPSGAKATQGVVLGPNHDLMSTPVLPAIRASRVGGLGDAGQKLVLATGDGTAQTTWVLDRDLGAVSSQATFSDPVLTHNPFPSEDSQELRLFVAGADTSVIAALLGSGGAVNTASMVSHATAGKVTALSCSDGPNHAHCVWTEDVPDDAGASRCIATDVTMRPRVSVPGGTAVSDDCRDAQASSGPSSADSMIVVWATSDHRLELEYLSAASSSPKELAAAGSAPKVKFDGTRFWIAWLDGNTRLRLSSYDLTGTLVTYSLIDWVPLGAAAFDLVRRGNETALALVSSTGFALLTICT